MKKLFLVICSLILSAGTSKSQNKAALDSLLILSTTGGEDISKAKVYVALSREYYQIDYDLSLTYCQKALELSKRLNYLPVQADAKKMLGNIIVDKGKFAEAIGYYEESYLISTSLKDSSNMAYSLNNIALTHSDMGNYPEAIKIYLKGLAIAEKINDKRVLGKLYNNMGLVYYYQKDYQNALQRFRKGLATRTAKDSEGLETNYNNFGVVYEEQELYDSALFYFYKAYELAVRNNNIFLKAAYLDNIGNVYNKQGRLDEAIQFNSQALEIREMLGDKLGIAVSSINKAGNLASLKKYGEAEKLLLRGINLSKEIGSRNTEKQAYNAISDLYFEMKNFEKAYHYFKKFTVLKDSILSESTANQVAEMETKYDTEKKQKEIEVLTAKNKVQELSSNRQSIIIWSIGGSSFLVILFAFIMWKRFRITKKQKKIIEEQKVLVDQKQKEVLDSIYYASRIQRSLLPTEKYIERNLNKLMGK